jgi:hypothetical protein
MRKGSVAIVPLMLGIFALFWFILFMGGENDNLHNINQIENLQHLQERLLLAAVKRRYELEKENPNMSETEITNAVDAYIHNIMIVNKIDE